MQCPPSQDPRNKPGGNVEADPSSIQSPISSMPCQSAPDQQETLQRTQVAGFPRRDSDTYSHNMRGSSIASVLSQLSDPSDLDAVLASPDREDSDSSLAFFSPVPTAEAVMSAAACSPGSVGHQACVASPMQPCTQSHSATSCTEGHSCEPGRDFELDNQLGDEAPPPNEIVGIPSPTIFTDAGSLPCDNAYRGAAGEALVLGSDGRDDGAVAHRRTVSVESALSDMSERLERELEQRRAMAEAATPHDRMGLNPVPTPRTSFVQSSAGARGDRIPETNEFEGMDDQGQAAPADAAGFGRLHQDPGADMGTDCVDWEERQLTPHDKRREMKATLRGEESGVLSPQATTAGSTRPGRPRTPISTLRQVRRPISLY